jgi:hypothetical protein
MSYRTKDGWDIVSKEEAQASPDPDRPRVVVPDPEQYEAMLKQLTDPRRCGNCEHFLHRLGQEEIKKQKVIPTAIHEHHHNVQWFGNQQQFGLCEQWEGHMTSAIGPITIPKHFVDSNCTYEDQDTSVECPYYRQKGKGLRSIRHYVGKARNWEE